MSVLGYFLSGSKVKQAKNLTLQARQEQGEKADQLFQQAYDNFAGVSASYSKYYDALYYWGFALLHQGLAESSSDKATKIFEESINKFSLCKTILPEHLGATLDGGVALMSLAKSKQVGLDDALYVKAKESFEAAEKIQSGSASYNLACLYALKNERDACLKALESARDHGLIPDVQNIVEDDDMENVKQMPWFAGFIESLAEEDVKEQAVKEIVQKEKEVKEPELNESESDN